MGKAQTNNSPAQTEIIKEKDTIKQMNLLDEQTKIVNQVFTLGGMSPGESPTKGTDNYLALLENMEGTDEQKTQLREIYDLYDTSLDSTKKEELRIKFTKMLEEAMAKSR